jgi:histidine phosphotransfer protein HptB
MSDEWADRDAIGRVRQFMGDTYPKLLEIFLTSTDGYVQKLQDALSTGDLKEITDAAHALKSSCASMGLKRLSVLIADLEEVGRKALTFEDVAGQVTPVIGQIAEGYKIARKALEEGVTS